MKSGREIRSEFLEFFKEKGHAVVPSSPVVPIDDPTLMFTNAGMNQFKDVFLGTGNRDFKRAADSQKCIRVTGKHNDLEEVGIDTYHHTFFEMLGNWSFGDYFKREAIEWAWEFLTDRMGLVKEKVYVTVFAGDRGMNLEWDEEAARYWKELTEVPDERILRFGVKDNFWEMADTGPCGPCSEIHYDLGPGSCDLEDDPAHECGVNKDCARYIELWNLVFIQFNRLSADKLSPLPAKHVDTGMGLERLAAVVQKKSSNYDTDLFRPIFKELGKRAGETYGKDAEKDKAFRVISDHVKALSVAIADNALPGREGRGYVLRRILRRAARFGRQKLGIREPFIHELTPVVAEIYSDIFPEIGERKDHISLVIKAEEEYFARTIDAGIARFEQMAAKLKKSNQDVIPGDQAYRMYHEGGFPRDLIDLMAREENLTVDEEGWKAAEEKHKKRSEGEAEGAEFDLAELEGLPATKFLGYWERGDAEQFGTKTGVRILKVIGEEAVVLDRTPFYAESGGQVGDTGIIYGEGFRFRVTDTGRIGDIVIHYGEIEKGEPDKLPEEATAEVDLNRRLNIMANHTATHLLHKSLRKLLGDQATQQGSYVGPDYLRFDFTHSRSLSDEEIETLELQVNQRIFENRPLNISVQDLDKAKRDGVTALFGEKYEKRVRVVEVQSFSKELCGGTHCCRTGDIGMFRIESESAVQAGIRRITAVTREKALEKTLKEKGIIEESAALLGAKNEELPTRIQNLMRQVSDLKKELKKSQKADVGGIRADLMKKAATADDALIIVEKIDDLSMDDMREVADALRSGEAPTAGLLAAVHDDKIRLLAFAAESAIKEHGIHAGKIVKETSGKLGGGGGGRPDFAQGGGHEVKELPRVLKELRENLVKKIGKDS